MVPRKTFDLGVHLEATGEKFRITECSNNMTIQEMKSKLELITAIPTNYQRLYYIDEGKALGFLSFPVLLSSSLHLGVRGGEGVRRSRQH